MTLTKFAPRVVSDHGSHPRSPYRVIGTVDLITTVTFHEMAQYPGADRWVECAPQSNVVLESNGYYVKATFTGTVTNRGYYGGELGVTETYTLRMYGYEADWLIAGPNDHDSGARTRAAYNEFVLHVDPTLSATPAKELS